MESRARAKHNVRRLPVYPPSGSPKTEAGKAGYEAGKLAAEAILAAAEKYPKLMASTRSQATADCIIAEVKKYPGIEAELRQRYETPAPQPANPEPSTGNDDLDKMIDSLPLAGMAAAYVVSQAVLINNSLGDHIMARLEAKVDRKPDLGTYDLEGDILPAREWLMFLAGLRAASIR